MKLFNLIRITNVNGRETRTTMVNNVTETICNSLIRRSKPVVADTVYQKLAVN